MIFIVCLALLRVWLFGFDCVFGVCGACFGFVLWFGWVVVWRWSRFGWFLCSFVFTGVLLAFGGLWDSDAFGGVACECLVRFLVCCLPMVGFCWVV